MSGRYPSRKMGVTIQFESHRVELAFVHEMEHDPDVLEFYDQPPSFLLAYPSKKGQRLRVLHTPDYFVLRQGAAGWVECKTEEQLAKLETQCPHRYCQLPDGRWRCPPGESHAGQLGLYYQVRSSQEINWIFQRNLLFLEDYLRSDAPLVLPSARDAVLTQIKTEQGLRLTELFHRAGDSVNRDAIYGMIARGNVYVNLEDVPIVEPERVRVFSSKDMALAYEPIATCGCEPEFYRSPFLDLASGSVLTWDSKVWTIGNVGETKIGLLGERGAFVELTHSTFEELVKRGIITGLQSTETSESGPKAQEPLAVISPTGLEEANRRYQIIQTCLNGEPIKDQAIPARTVFRWVSRYRTAEATHGNGYLGLLPRWPKSGNRTRKLPEKTRALMGEFIEKEYETFKQKPKLEVYGALVGCCESAGVASPSYKTFTLEVNRRPRYEQLLKRKGPRAAYSHEPFYLELELTTPRHGDCPFQIGHIDHTELDIELICSSTGRNLGRPWLTILTDAFSRRLLAVFLTFDPPSYRSCMMVLRECIRRHGRFPQSLVVDGGKEFDSIYFESLLARYECTKKTRPPAKARFGSVCERLFGTANTRFIHNLQGNTQITRNVRQVTKGVDPKRHAQWTLARLYESLCQWAYEVYDTLPHPALGQSPRETFASGLLRSGKRPHRMVAYDGEFRLWTLPTTAKKTAQVVPGKGVKINHIFYWAAAFRDPEVEQTQVPVRYDPYDAGTAYAYVGKCWVQCVSEYYTMLHGRSERELMLATAELRKRMQEHTRQFTITAKKLAAFLDSIEGERLLDTQRLQDREAKTVLMTIQGDSIARLRPESKAETHSPACSPTPSRETSTKTLHLDQLAVYEEY
ncbi:MAG: DDE-type integrase/transposase/recombinase [Acidobacteria bacterium]|nr:DDE-type integrase/transposase/recombinase [Acidobacteriota bacterium]